MSTEKFLECMFNNLDDIHEGTDEEVEKELNEMGVDIEKAKESFFKNLELVRAKHPDKFRSKKVCTINDAECGIKKLDIKKRGEI